MVTDTKNGSRARSHKGDTNIVEKAVDDPSLVVNLPHLRGVKRTYTADSDGVAKGEKANLDTPIMAVEKMGSCAESGGGTCITVDAEHHSLCGTLCATTGLVVPKNFDSACEVVKKHGEKTVAGTDVCCGTAVVEGRSEISDTLHTESVKCTEDAGARHTTHIDTDRDGTSLGLNSWESMSSNDVALRNTIVSGGTKDLGDTKVSKDVGSHGVTRGRLTHKGMSDPREVSETRREQTRTQTDIPPSWSPPWSQPRSMV